MTSDLLKEEIFHGASKAMPLMKYTYDVQTRVAPLQSSRSSRLRRARIKEEEYEEEYEA